MRGTWIVAVALLVVLAPAGLAHKYNHEMKHETCDVTGMTPHGHFIGDGHEHTHDPAEAAGDPKEFHPHNPCNQTRMAYPGYTSVAPIKEVSPPAKELDPTDIIWDDADPTNSEVYVGGEAYQFPIKPGSFQERDALVISSDADAASHAAAGDIKGSGTKADPYIIENYIFGRVLSISDTSACFVIRNNVVVDRVLEAPLVEQPDDLVNVTKLIQELLKEIEGLLADIARYLGITEEWEALKANWDENATIWDADKLVWDTQKGTWEADRAAMDAELARFNQELAAWQQAINDYEIQYLDAVEDTEELAANFEYYIEFVLGHDPSYVTQPPQQHQEFIQNGVVSSMKALEEAFQTYQDEASALVGDLSQTGNDVREGNFDVRDMIDETDPGTAPPPGYPGSDWQVDRQRYDEYREWIRAEVQRYWDDLQPLRPDYDGYEAFLASYQKFQDEYAAFVAAHEAFLADYNDFLAQYQVFISDYENFLAQYWAVIDEYSAKIAAAQARVTEAEALIDSLEGFAWKLGDLLFETLDDVLKYLLELALGLINPDDPNEVANNDGQLILDWNGQCLHVYNNVINDLRVNQNNDRTGEATGGVIENNRIYTIGQIRHYDGIFRDNEVGNRAHLYSLIDPSIQAPANDQSVNNDGANQGWYFDNIIYGNVDLDFHGHHHSAGFFSPESHYHGSSYRVAYMVNPDGSCTFTHDEVMHGGGHHHGDDNDFQVLGETIIDGPDPTTCLPHHDHSKRWTSVFFNDNVIIDPNGQGIRFEDENHRADDEQANSENMVELKKPHFHQKFVQVENNSVVGRIFMDVVNAKGTFLWSDDWSEVENTEGVARTQEALDHPGARIAYSHPMRNDAWIDIQRNTVFQTQSVGILVDDAEFLTQLQIKDNRAFGVPTTITGTDFESLRQWLWDARYASAATVKSGVDAWGTQDRGAQSFAVVRDAIDGFNVVFCGNYLHKLDSSLVATDRIYQDGASTIDHECTPDDENDDRKSNVLGIAKAPSVVWTAAPEDRVRFSEPLRALTADTDSFYILELAYDMADALLPGGTVEPPPVEDPTGITDDDEHEHDHGDP